MMSGACLCGAVRITIPGETARADACHCSMCRKLVGGGPLFTVTSTRGIGIEGEAEVTRFRSSDAVERAFCRRCGTTLFSHVFATGDHFVSAGMIDDAEVTIGRQIFIDDKPDLYTLADDTSRLTGAEFIASYTADRRG